LYRICYSVQPTVLIIINIKASSKGRNSRVNEAVKVFALNVKEKPQSANAFDSLGEGYFSIKNYTLALENYKKSLELNPENTNASNMINKIQNLTTKN
jgi:tetratricopeptide (TPR) repeat protein